MLLLLLLLLYSSDISKQKHKKPGQPPENAMTFRKDRKEWYIEALRRESQELRRNTLCDKASLVVVQGKKVGLPTTPLQSQGNSSEGSGTEARADLRLACASSDDGTCS